MIGALFSQDLALDFGSWRTRLYVRDAGVVVDVPTVLAVRTRRSGRREVLAVGEDAAEMVGRAPDGVRVERPVRQGAVVTPEVAEAFLGHLVRAVHGRTTWARPRVAVATAPDASEATRRTIRDCCTSVGARVVTLVDSPVVAAQGAGLDEAAGSGHMIVDVGASTCHIAVICRGEVVAATTLDVAGEVFDGAIIRHLRREHALMVGPVTSERAKIAVGTAAVPGDAGVTVAGRCLRRGVPRAVELSADEVAAALTEPVAAIGASVRRVLEQAPAELASDVVDHGVILVGGGSLLRNLDLALRACTGLAMLPVDAPDQAVIRGIGAALEAGPVFRRRQRPRRSATTDLMPDPG